MAAIYMRTAPACSGPVRTCPAALRRGPTPSEIFEVGAPVDFNVIPGWARTLSGNREAASIIPLNRQPSPHVDFDGGLPYTVERITF